MICSGLYPCVSMGDIEGFQHRTGLVVPSSLKWFWMNVGNGGRPKPVVYVPFIHSSREQTHAEVTGLFGIDRNDKCYDIQEALETYFGDPKHQGLQIGYDAGSNPFLLVLEGPQNGQIWYMNRGEFIHGWPRTELVAPNINAFAELLRN